MDAASKGSCTHMTLYSSRLVVTVPALAAAATATLAVTYATTYPYPLHLLMGPKYIARGSPSRLRVSWPPQQPHSPRRKS